MKVSAAIPNFNGKSYLEKLIPQLREQSFDQIFVCDDGSTDGSVEWLKTQADIMVLGDGKNLGPPGNRNRIVDQVTEGLILFLDADMELLTNDIPEKLRKHFADFSQMAVAGALIVSNKNEPMWYNWGYDFSPKRDGIDEALSAVALAHWENEAVMRTVREKAKGWAGHLEPVQDREVDWVCEGFFAVRADVFTQLRGFDSKFIRYHSGPDFCKRAGDAGFSTRFFVDIKLCHLDQRTGSDTERSARMRESTKYWYRKHYNIPDEIIERFFLWKQE